MVVSIDTVRCIKTNIQAHDPFHCNKGLIQLDTRNRVITDNLPSDFWLAPGHCDTVCSKREITWHNIFKHNHTSNEASVRNMSRSRWPSTHKLSTTFPKPASKGSLSLLSSHTHNQTYTNWMINTRLLKTFWAQGIWVLTTRYGFFWKKLKLTRRQELSFNNQLSKQMYICLVR